MYTVSAQDLHRTRNLLAAVCEESLLYLAPQGQEMIALAQDASCLLSYQFPMAGEAASNSSTLLSIQARDFSRAVRVLPRGKSEEVACVAQDGTLVFTAADRKVQVPLREHTLPLPEIPSQQEGLILELPLEVLFAAAKRMEKIAGMPRLCIELDKVALCVRATDGDEEVLAAPALGSSHKQIYPLPVETLVRVLRGLRKHIVWGVSLTLLPDQIRVHPNLAQREVRSYAAILFPDAAPDFL